MSPQFSENLLIKIYVEVDDLLKGFQGWSGQRALGKIYQPTRAPELSASEVTTILIAYHLSGYKCFEYYYRECILKDYLADFPGAPVYQRFVSDTAKALLLLFLVLLLKCAQSQRTGYYVIDSKQLEVCHLKREHSHRVFKDFSRKGSTGWFYGLKLHLVINHLGRWCLFSLPLPTPPITTTGHSPACCRDLKESAVGIKATSLRCLKASMHRDCTCW